MGQLHGLQLEAGKTKVALDVNGAVEAAVTFVGALSADFVSTPAILIVPNQADVAAGASYAVKAGSDSKTGFTIKITGSKFISQDRDIRWVAVEKE